MHANLNGKIDFFIDGHSRTSRTLSFYTHLQMNAIFSDIFSLSMRMLEPSSQRATQCNFHISSIERGKAETSPPPFKGFLNVNLKIFSKISNLYRLFSQTPRKLSLAFLISFIIIKDFQYSR